MKKILLIHPIVRKWAKPNCFPTGLGYIASVFENKNWDVTVLDLNADRDAAIPQICYKPDLVGITGIITQYSEVKKIAQRCRVAYGDIPIVAGGPLASSVPELLLSKTCVDICVRGEGERVAAMLADAVQPIKTRNMIYQVQAHKNISDFHMPTYHLFPTDVYVKNPIAADNTRKWKDGEPSYTKRRSINIIGSRGCPFNCIYCAHNYMGQGWRKRENLDILNEMLFLKNKYDVDYIHFTDDAFSCSNKAMQEFSSAKKKNRYLRDVKWSCAGRANVVTDIMVKKMKQSGCIGLCYGLESGSQKILNNLNKKITIQQYEKAIKLNKKYFDYEDYTFIIGSPGESIDTIKESIDFCKRNEIVPSAAFFLTPYPGTPLFDMMVDKGQINPKDHNLMDKFVDRLGEQGEQLIWNFTDVPDSEVLDWHGYFLEETGAQNTKKHTSTDNNIYVNGKLNPKWDLPIIPDCEH